MCYQVYKLMTIAESNLMVENNKYALQGASDHLYSCLRKISEIIRYNDNVPYFDFKKGWKLFKNRNYGDLIIQIKVWIKKCDTRYDGHKWTEK